MALTVVTHGNSRDHVIPGRLRGLITARSASRADSTRVGMIQSDNSKKQGIPANPEPHTAGGCKVRDESTRIESFHIDPTRTTTHQEATPPIFTAPAFLLLSI